MNVKNVNQTIPAQAILLLPPGLIPPEFAKSGDERDLGPEAKAALLGLGAKLPTDLVPVTLSLGTLLFDIYYSAQTAPDAPLRKALFEKNRQDFAVRLSGDSFELSDQEIEDIELVLDEDDKWRKVGITIYTGGPTEATKKYYTFGHGIAGNFNNVMKACIEIFQPPVVQAAAPAVPAVPAAPAKSKKKKK